MDPDAPPTGAVTFLFSDIEEGSLPRFGGGADSGGVTMLWEQHPDGMRHALARHDELLHQAILLEESLAIRRELGDPRGIAYTLSSLGDVYKQQSDLETARTLYEESLTLLREVGDKRGLASSLMSLGNLALLGNDWKTARTLHQESLTLFKELQDKQSIAGSIEALGKVAAAQGQMGRTAHLFGAAEALREVLGTPVPPLERADYERHVAAARAALGELKFRAAWEEGRGAPPEGWSALDQALGIALDS